MCAEFKGSALGKVNNDTIQAPCISWVTNRRVNSYSNSHYTPGKELTFCETSQCLGKVRENSDYSVVIMIFFCIE